MKRAGFTLMEVLVAMVLIGAVLIPTCGWLYKSRASRQAFEKFRAVQALELRMNRALLLRAGRDVGEEIAGPPYLRIEIHPVKDGAETRLIGTAKDRKGAIITKMEAAYFTGTPP